MGSRVGEGRTWDERREGKLWSVYKTNEKYNQIKKPATPSTAMA